MKNFRIICYVILALGVSSEIFSYLLFEGLFAELNYICGSACEIWPGIQISAACIEICIIRNGYYFHFFILGVILIMGSIITLIIQRNYLDNKLNNRNIQSL